MEIGDKVRLLHGREEGIIRRFIDRRTVEIEIEDGFLIPVLKNEVVSIATEEIEQFTQETAKPLKQTENTDQYESLSNEDLEIYLGLEVNNDQLILWLINFTSRTLLFTVHSQKRNVIAGLTLGVLKKFNYAKIDAWSMKDQDEWPILIMDINQYATTGNQYFSPLNKKIRVKDKWLVKKPFELPLLNKKGVLVRLNEEEKLPDTEKIKESFFRGPATDEKKDIDKRFLDWVVDLHAEALNITDEGIDSQEILNIQLQHFEKKLEQAVIKNADTVSFIHGIGNGTLRHFIHKKLSQYPHIRYFEDDQKEKFGYGATKVHLK